MKITNKELIQSYIVTTAKYDFSVYEKRILYRIIEKMQFELEGQKLDKTFVPKNLFGDMIIRIPVKEFLNGEHDKNHSRAKKALADLRNKTIEIEDEKSWRLLGIIEKPKVEMYDGVAVFEINKEIYEVLLNFAKGYRKYELTTAFNFESVYAMRFYELFSGKTTKITYSIEALKKMFGIADKYMGRPASFISKVVKVGKDELDKKKSPYTFDFTTKKTGRILTHVDFYPKKTKYADEAIEKKKSQKSASPRWVLSKPLIFALQEKYGFGDKEIKIHLDLLGEANEKLDLLSLLSEKAAYCSGRNNPIGSIITIIRKELKNTEEL